VTGINFGVLLKAKSNITKIAQQVQRGTKMTEYKDPLEDTSEFWQVVTTISVTRQQVANLLVSAFEGGSNYWYTITEFGNPDKVPVEFSHIDLPFSENGYLMIGTNEDGDDGVPDKRLDKEALRTGLMLMARKYPRHFRDLMDDNEDATTGDVFLQCCLFGKVIF
jgi:hypothetical protein